MRRSAIEYHRPERLADVFELRGAPDTWLVAGGTDLMVRVREGAVRPRAIVSLRRIPELGGIEVADGARIGALTRVSQIVRDGRLGERWTALALAARSLGSAQIRNMATVGGNLCNASPCADLAPPLLAADARATVVSPRGSREMDLADLFEGPRVTALAPDEVLQDIRLGAPPAGSRSIFLKKGRVAMDIALASISVQLLVDSGCLRSVRVAAGSLAPTPVRLRRVEAALEGKPPDEDVLSLARAAACEEVRPISDVRASADYRRHLAGAFVERAVRSLAGGNGR